MKTSTGLRFKGGYRREIDGAGERSERINQRAYVLSDRFRDEKREDEAAKIKEGRDEKIEFFLGII